MILARLLIIAIFLAEIEASTDPCETNNFIDNWKRSTVYIPIDGKFICDSLIAEDWYRITSGAGDLMPTECIDGGWRCGTVNPIYLSTTDVPDNETVFPPTGADVVRKAYSVNDNNCNFKEYSIRIKNCSSFYVYYLKRTKGCDSAYCFGSEQPCPDGELSETGFTPGCSAVYPTKNLTPKLGVAMHEDSSNGKIYKTPAFRCEAADATDEYSYDIQYYINEVLIPGAVYTNVSHDELASAKLFQIHWENTFKPNMLVKCSMQARYIDRGVPGEKHYSDVFFAGIKVLNENGLVIKEGETKTIEVKVTLPIGCSYNVGESYKALACYVGLRNGVPAYQTPGTCAQENNLEFGEENCVLKIQHDSWDTGPHKVHVTARSDQIVTNADRIVNLRLYTGILSNNQQEMLAIWTKFTLPDVKIYIHDTDIADLGKACYSHNDPHMRIFDGTPWELQGSVNEGEYIMYKHISLPQQINAYFRPCYSWDALCNCGVAIRSGDSLFIANFCPTGSSGNRRINRYVVSRLCDDQNLVIEEPSSNKYKVTLPSGSTVEFTHGEVQFNEDTEYGIFQIDIRPSNLDFDHTKGLCGNYNNNPNDDFVKRNEHFPTASLDEFANSWKVTNEGETFFNPNGVIPPINYVVQEYCTCINDNDLTEEKPPKYNCRRTDEVKVCENTVLTKTVYHASCISSAHGRKRRSTETNSENDDNAPPMFEMVTDLNDTVVREPAIWRNGLSEEIARAKCESHMNSLPAYAACTEYVPSANASAFIEECVTDMKIAGSDSFLQMTLQNFESSCFSDAKKIQNLTETNTTSSTGESKSIFAVIAESTCPRNCSGKGSCNEGVCSCMEGSYGHDCSLDKTKAPRLLKSAIEGKCDSFKKSCKRFAVPGMDFIEGNLTCKFRPFKVLTNGSILVDIESVIHPAVYFSSFLMYCELPDSRRKRSVVEDVASNGYYISVSNDGKNFTEELTMMVFDTRCFECNSTTLQCSELDTCPSVVITPKTSETNYLGVGVGIGVAAVILVLILAFFIKKKCIRRKPAISDSSLGLPNPHGWCAEKPVLQSTDIFIRDKTTLSQNSYINN